MVEFAPEDDAVQVNIKSSDIEVGGGGLSVEDAANLEALASAVDNGGGSNTNFLAVTVATIGIADGSDETLGSKVDVAVTAIQDTTPTTVVGILKGIFNKLYSIFGTGIPITSLPDITVVSPAILFAPIAVGADATGAIVAADATHKIRVLFAQVVGHAAGTYQFKSATTALTGAMDYALATGANPSCPYGIMETAINQALNLTTVGAAANGMIAYILV